VAVAFLPVAVLWSCPNTGGVKHTAGEQADRKGVRICRYWPTW